MKSHEKAIVEKTIEEREKENKEERIKPRMEDYETGKINRKNSDK